MTLIITAASIHVLVMVTQSAIGEIINVANCSKLEDCGWKAVCDSGQCTCLQGYKLHSNGRDCMNVQCKVNDCVECTSEGKCIRCVNFISAANGQCLEKCSGQAEVSVQGTYQGNVCTENDDKIDIIIAVVAGVAAGLLLCAIITLCVCFYIRKTRKKINLQDKSYKSGQMEMGKLRQIPHYDNKAFETDSQVDFRASVVDPDLYLQQLELLRPHTETLMTVLSDIRHKLRSMDPADPRVPTYKGVIHQLCRVLVLLHKKDSTTSIPSDALGLIEWAQQMLEDHREQHEEHSSSDARESPVNKISYIDVDFEKLNTHPHVYATPVGSANHNVATQDPSSSHNTSGYYSSVPVPLGTNLNNSYATINRSPANPSLFNAAKNVNNNKLSFKKVNNTTKVRAVNNYPKAYFANGRYYDPNPRTEVYAPASSYSDRSAGPLSTFLGDLPRSESVSTNAASNGGDNVDDFEDDYEGDVFPFDPREATDPVEV